MSKFYIAGFVKEADGSGYSVYFPDVPNICAAGSSIEEAIQNATEGLYLAMRGLVEDKEEIPLPSDLETVKKMVREERELDGLPYPEDTIYQYIQAPDLDMVPVRVNITIPKCVLEEIDRTAKLAGMTRSGFLALAAKKYAADMVANS